MSFVRDYINFVQTLRLDVISLPVGCIFQARNLKAHLVYGIAAKRMFHGYSYEVRNLPEVTSRLI